MYRAPEETKQKATLKGLNSFFANLSRSRAERSRRIKKTCISF